MPEILTMPEKFNYGIDTLTIGNAIEIAKEMTTAYDNFCGKKNSPEEVVTVKNYIEHRYQVKLEDLDL